MKDAVSNILEQFNNRFGKYPKFAQFDQGTEFYNKEVKLLLNKHNIEFFSTYSDKKAAVVERFNRTLKALMWKYFYSVSTYKWLDVLQDLTDNYNSSVNRSIKLMFKSEKGIDGSGTQIMKRGKSSMTRLQTPEPEQAVDINEVSGQNSFISEVSEFENIELVNIEQQTDTDISGLTQEENRELRGVIKPKESVLWSSRIGENGALQKQVDHFNETIYETIEMRDQADDIEEYRRLDSRVEALRKARDKTAFQRELEEVRFKQVEDISRFKRFKDWLGENKVGLTGIAVSTAALITTLIVGTRGAIIGAAKATGKVAKALANLARKGAPILIPVLNALATALSWGAKGITWLASNLWVLAIAAALLTYDYLQR
ncbi:Maverick integrase [Paramuricea clavata]|uniref:Maverick integrase n=1 Tax=Paramuricea clavata TaxID=317549 RepID=A0A7D9HGQ8_PARCT|nr:Maverick integrase [Paramuricea clavata]